ncbi:cytochrome P450 [Streptomyces sp. NPDC090106]|uniref:cytochrome P450 n=1 Tax=Streptomyces sp. NPDC090106 TaxID=3365946 RepID=UPI00381988D1
MDFDTESAERAATRKVMAAPLSPRRVGKLRFQASAIANELLDSIFAESTPMHCMPTYAWPLPEQVASLHLGIPSEFIIPLNEMQRFLASGDVLAASNVTEFGRDSNGKMNGLTEFALDLIATKKAQPGDDVLSELVQAQHGPDGLTDRQILLTTLVLLMSASGSTAVRIETGIGLFSAHPEQYDAIIRDPRLIPSAVDEIMRMCNGIYDPTIRYARIDFKLRDSDIKEGDLVILDITSAHCDPRVFPEPLKFDITRRPNKQIGFGYGSTRCAGVALARLSLEAAFEALALRCAELPFLPPSPPNDRPLASW